MLITSLGLILVFAQFSHSRDICNLSGRWSSVPYGKTSVAIFDIVHQRTNTVTVSSPYWKNSQGYGITNGSTLILTRPHVIKPEVGEIAASPFSHYYTHQSAENCTWIAFEEKWCRFPYCSIDEPPVLASITPQPSGTLSLAKLVTDLPNEFVNCYYALQQIWLFHRRISIRIGFV